MTTYRFVDLAAASGVTGDYFLPTGVNDLGQVVGDEGPPSLASGYSGFIYTSGILTAPVDDSDSVFAFYPAAINDIGQIAGSSLIFTSGGLIAPAFIDTNGVVTYTIAVSAYTSINNLGQVTSAPYVGINDSGVLITPSFEDDHGHITPISDPLGTSTEATGINDAGIIVGSYADAAGRHGFIDDHGIYTTVDAPRVDSTFPGDNDTVLTGISNAGQIVGIHGNDTGFVASPEVAVSDTVQLAGQTYTAAYIVAPGGVLIGQGTLATSVVDNGTVASDGGLLILQAGASGAGTLLVHAGATMELPMSVTIGAIIDRGRLEVVNAVQGRLPIVANVTAGSFTVDAGAVLVGEGKFHNLVANSGTIEATGGLLDLVYGASGSGQLLVEAGAELKLGGPTITGSIVDDGTVLINDHTVHFMSATVGAGGLVEGSGGFLGTITNNGEIEATGGLLTLGAVSGSGKLAVGDGASLELRCATAQDVTFLGKTGSLLFDNPSDFSGLIKDLTGGDSLVFQNATVSSAVVHGGILTVSGAGGTVASLHVAGLADGTAFATPNAHTLTLA